MGGQVRGKGCGTDPAGEYTFFFGKGNENHELDTGLFVHEEIISAFKRDEFVSDVVHNTTRSLVPYHCSEHSSPTEDKMDDVKESFYEEL
jgi:hypothetical protein